MDDGWMMADTDLLTNEDEEENEDAGAGDNGYDSPSWKAWKMM